VPISKLPGAVALLTERAPAAPPSSIVHLDSDPVVSAHFRFDRIVCSNLANNAAARLPLSWRRGHLAGDDSSAIGARP
jgi:hypothetical protein